jgi:hypothetical protein
VTKHNLAEMKTEITVARAFTDQCLRLHNEGRLDSGIVLKLYVRLQVE